MGGWFSHRVSQEEFVLSVQNLTKQYQKVLANDHLTFDANPGEITLIVGPNGAGKSTAIKCIAGLLRFQGDVLICGHPNKTVEAKREFGYIPEIPAPYDLSLIHILCAWESPSF